MEKIINEIIDNKILNVLIIFVALDTFLGCLRAIKEKKWNSCFGINGVLRKIAMLGSILFLMIIDYLFSIDVIGFIPDDLTKYIGDIKIGISGLFGFLFIIYEFTSILKNMIKCDLPIPIKLKNKLEELLNNFTTELKNND